MVPSLLTDDEFKALIDKAPLVSIDLIVKNKKNEILLGFRKNAPAKNTWFLPGGRILKNEKLDEAFVRITLNELNQKIDRSEATFLNNFEHFYENENKFEIEGIDTHYIVICKLPRILDQFKLESCFLLK